MNQFRVLTVVCLMLFIAGCAQSDLPSHTVASKTSLGPKGYRIEIHVTDPNLSKEECKKLLRAYTDEAAPNGQVSVRKPDSRGQMQPWGVDNLDGSGVFFNDAFFQ